VVMVNINLLFFLACCICNFLLACHIFSLKSFEFKD
jgi:hypothetical protein